jgi:pimeloyl-ACP methyl ester carboxylesterase
MNHREYERLQKVQEVGERYLSYVDQGHGPPVVFIHGTPTWGYVWHALLTPLSAANRMLIPDLLGFGRSDRSDGFDRSLGRQAEALITWLDLLGIERATLVGHDLGGGIALRLAVQAPERIERLCLIDSAAYDAGPSRLMVRLDHPRTARNFPAAAFARLLRASLARGFARAPAAEILDGLVAPYTTEVGKLSLIRDAAALDSNLTVELVPRLGRLRLPVLVLWGERDPLQNVAHGVRLADDIPGAKLVRLEAGHFPMIERAGEVEERLLAFLRERPAVAPRRPAPPRPARGPRL